MLPFSMYTCTGFLGRWTECEFDPCRGLKFGVFSLTQFLLCGLGLEGFNLPSSLHSAPNGHGSSCVDLPFGGFIFHHLKVEP